MAQAPTDADPALDIAHLLDLPDVLALPDLGPFDTADARLHLGPGAGMVPLGIAGTPRSEGRYPQPERVPG